MSGNGADWKILAVWKGILFLRLFSIEVLDLNRKPTFLKLCSRLLPNISISEFMGKKGNRSYQIQTSQICISHSRAQNVKVKN